RRYSDLGVKVQIGTDQEGPTWDYELTLSQDNQRRPIVRTEQVRRDGAVLLNRPQADDVADPELLTQTFLEQVNVNREFRAVSDFFRGIRYLHIVPQLVREPDRSVGRTDDPYGGDCLEQIARTHEGPQES